MTLKHIRMELARDHDFPRGSRDHGYLLVAPLDNMDRIDPAEWKANRDKCRVTRFWGSDEHEIGHLIRKPGGAWAFHYDIHGNEDDDETDRLINVLLVSSLSSCSCCCCRCKFCLPWWEE